LTVNADLLKSMKYRNIGPTRGGRVVAVAGDPSDKRVFYFGSTGGGVWKTSDGGVTWENVSDGYFKRASVGALQVSKSDPNVIYAGMGETTIRGNVSRGDGVYKSTDAGKSWVHCGLEDTQNISEIEVHPTNPDIVYVGGFGHVWGKNEERGVYRSKDGGKSWKKVLYRSDKAGVCDITMDPTNPRILYVAFWEAHRTPYSLESGGPDSSIYKTEDGGDTWIEVTRNTGLPQEGLLGKIGLAAAPKGGRVWAIIDHVEEPGVYRSDDYGETWKKLTGDANLIQRPWYWMHIEADPQDPDTLWCPNFELWRSVDGGTTWQAYSTPHVDNHDLWFDPSDPDRMIMGNDGGSCVSYNGGLTWSTQYNQPTAEMYHVITDNRQPYQVYGAQQDNTTIRIPSRSNSAAINFTEWEEVGGGESGYIAIRPDDPNIVFAGSYQGLLTRYDQGTGLQRNITVWSENASGHAASEMKYRFQWTSPTLLSPHSPNTLYTAGNILFRSSDDGHSWDAISPDLTRADPETMGPSGGPVTKDMTGAEFYGTIFAVAESPVEPGVIWAGSDDGLLHVTRDGGQSWENVNPPELPDWSLISIIEASSHDGGTAYVAATRYKSHDDRPYLFKTSDYGKTWTKIVNGIPDWDFTRVIREDPERNGLLFAGTETGMYVSLDDGENWQLLKLNLPLVPIHDFVIHEGDLVVATHGRGFWILDDITPLRQMADDVASKAMHLFKPRDTIRYAGKEGFGHAPVEGKNLRFAGGLIVTFKRETKPDGEVEITYLDAGHNPPDGVVVHYSFKENPEDEVTLTFTDGDGNTVRSFSSKKDEKKKEQTVRAEAGANRFTWNMRLPDATLIEGDEVSKTFVTGPRVVPGSYHVQLKVGDGTLTESFEIIGDPRVGSTQEDFDAQFALQKQIHEKISAAHEGVGKIRAITKQIEAWEERLDDEGFKSAAKDFKEKLKAVEGEIVQTKAKGPKDRLKYPVMLNSKLASLQGVVASAEGRPTRQSYELYDDLAGRVDAALGRLDALLESDLAALNQKISAARVTPVST
jgi:photosystem II stability/assembly factor-like uncharacterized protein